MKKTILACMLTFVFAGLFVFSSAFGAAKSNPTVSVTSSTTSGVTTLTVTVTGLANGDMWKDFHVSSGGKNLRFPQLTGINNVSVSNANGSTQAWHAHRSTGGSDISFYTGTDSTAPAGWGNGTYTITIPWTDDGTKGKGQKGNPVTWSATSTGTQTCGSTGIIDDSTDQTAPNVPQTKCSANSGVDMEVAVGAAIEYEGVIDPAFAGYDYEEFLATALNERDATGLDLTQAPPVAWGIDMPERLGVIGEDGVVKIKAYTAISTSLVGQTLYVVHAVKDTHGVVLYASDPIAITFTN